jgi:cell division septal protein FtsQ
MGNRRKRREKYLLDVKVQPQGQLRRRARIGATVLAALLVFALGLFGLYRLAKFVTARLVYDNPRFAIAQIIVHNDGVLTPEQVLRLAGVSIGANAFSLDLDQVRRNLEMIPLVRHVEVRRVLPNRLFIRVEERVAVARLQVPSESLSDAVFLIDRTGAVMKPLKLADGSLVQPQISRKLPVLTGVTLADVRVGKQVESEQVYQALTLLDKLEQSAAGSMLEVERVDLSKPRSLVLTTTQQTVVRFDVEELPQQLRRLGVILSWAQQRQRLVRMADLTISRSVPVTFAN